jgi:hypothetical protein
MALTLTDLKTWLRDDRGVEDDVLTVCLTAAIDYVAARTGEDLSGEVDGLLKVLVLQYAGHLYANREATSPLDVKPIPGFERALERWATPATFAATDPTDDG